MQRISYALLGAIVLLASVSGVAGAVPTDSPPDEASDRMPDFVSNGVGAVTDFVGDLLDGVFEFVDGLTPDAADRGIETARDAAPG